MGKLLEDKDMFIILADVYMLKLIKSYTLNMYDLLYVSYTSIKMLKYPRKKNLKDIFLFSSHSYFQWTLLSFL